MKKIKSRFALRYFSIIGLAMLVGSCSPTNTTKTKDAQNPILKSEIIAFQKAYGVSFNAIAEAIENNTYYEAAAKKHIAQNYNFNEGKVMFKFGDTDDPFRYTEDGILSYLIGKNKSFPNDEGIAKENWRKMEWTNDGIYNDDKNFAVVMGRVKLLKENDQELVQNYTMCLKRNAQGALKLIAHKIAKPCN